MSKPRIPKATRAKAAAKVLVDGKDKRQAARELGVSEATVRRAVQDAETEPDLSAYVAAYRARAVPKWLEIVDKAAKQAEEALPGTEARDAAFVAKTFAEMAQRGAGEPDVKHGFSGGADLSKLSTEDLRALDAILAKADAEAEPG